MSTVFSHAFAAVALGKAYGEQNLPRRFWLLSIFCACIPDADVIGFAFGIQYGDVLGHRGFTHSLSFAFLLSLAVTLIAFKRIPVLSRHWLILIVYFFIVTGSHGVLDAMTNGGLGIAFFSPFDTTRYFLPWRPLDVPPIGVVSFFSQWGLRVLLNEILWIWLPCAGLILVMPYLRRARS